MLKVASVNVNGIRAAFRKGMEDWINQADPDVLLLQEVRAPEDIVSSLLGSQWEVFAVPCRIKGRAGVAIAVKAGAGVLSRRDFLYEDDLDVDSGRWAEVTLDTVGPDGSSRPFTVVSAYLHSGELDSPKQEQKMAYLQKVSERLPQLEGACVVAGDFNVVRSEYDIKNWKPNHNKRSGVLDCEIAFLDSWMNGERWTDLTRHHLGEGVQAPYTWWSFRGRAFDNDAGWRIDYQMVTDTALPLAGPTWVDRASQHDSRWSDHAPLVAEYNLSYR